MVGIRQMDEGAEGVFAAFGEVHNSKVIIQAPVEYSKAKEKVCSAATGVLELRQYMKQAKLYIPLGFVLVLLAAQVVPVQRDNPPVTVEVTAPEDVKVLLKNACYDCHSNETKWPVYSRVAPFSWLVAHHVHEGRENVNFSTWGGLTDDARSDTLRAIVKEVRKGEMPISNYTWMHPEARLTEAQRQRIVEWARSK